MVLVLLDHGADIHAAVEHTGISVGHYMFMSCTKNMYVDMIVGCTVAVVCPHAFSVQ